MCPDDSYGRHLLRGLWLLVRLPVLTLLVILEPVAALVLGGSALAGVLTTLYLHPHSRAAYSRMDDAYELRGIRTCADRLRSFSSRLIAVTRCIAMPTIALAVEPID
jgi:hypothetical protein